MRGLMSACRVVAVQGTFLDSGGAKYKAVQISLNKRFLSHIYVIPKAFTAFCRHTEFLRHESEFAHRAATG